MVVAHNDLGFRRQEEHPELPVPSHNVFVLGDSFVWGYGVGQSEVITDQMSTRLPEYRVQNFGLAGSGTVEQLSIFNRYVRDQLRRGDVVVLAFLGNDFRDNVGHILNGRLHATIENGEIREIAPEPRSSSAAWLKNKLKDASYLFNLLSYSSGRLKDWRFAPAAGPRSKPSPEATQADTADDSASVTVTRHYLAALSIACQDKGVPFLVAYIPGQAELAEDDMGSTEDLTRSEQRAYRAAFFRNAQSLDLETIDLLPRFLAVKQSSGQGRLTFEHDFHWNADGHALAATVICESIRASRSVAQAVEAPATADIR